MKRSQLEIGPSVIAFTQPLVQSALERALSVLPSPRSEMIEALSSDLLRELLEEFSSLFLSDYAAIAEIVSIDDFEAALSDDQLRSVIYARYPMLRHRLLLVTEAWVLSTTDVLSWLARDAYKLRSRGFIQSGVPLAYQSGLGDHHNGRKSVTCVTFDDGVRLLFKPRSNELDLGFERVLNAFGSRGSAKVLVPKTLGGNLYHWQEFITHEELRFPSDAAEYYRNLGYLIGVLGLLRGTDVHRENVISCGRFPAIIDLETLFHPRWTNGPLEQEDLVDAVLRVGLLPVQLELGERGIYSNQVGLRSNGGHGGAAPEINRETSLSLIDCMPRYRGQAVGYADHVNDIVQGVRDACQSAIENKTAIVREIRRLVGMRQRYIYQHTKLYSSILRDLRQAPFFLSQTHVEDYLKGLIPQNASSGSLAFADAEKIDLMNLDVPIFYSFIGGKEIFHRTGQPPIVSGASDSFAFVEKVFNDLDDSELARLEFFVRETLHLGIKIEAVPTAPDIDGAAIIQAGSSAAVDNAEPIADEDVHQALERYRCAFLKDRYNQDGIPHWIILRSARLDNSAIEICRPSLDLHHGAMGEALTLTICDRILGQKNDLATDVIAGICEKLKHGVRPWDKLGILTGLGGIIYGHLALASLGKTESLTVLKNRMIEEDLHAAIHDDRDLTLAAGTAGLMAALADVHFVCQDRLSLDLALECHEKLKASVTARDGLFGWIKHYPKPLTGLAHGFSGYAVAYSKLYRATRDAQWMEMAVRCFAAEDTYFDDVAQSWPDFRHDPPKFPLTWAHGAPGIGLSRIVAYECGLPSDVVEPMIKNAVRATLSHSDFRERGLTTSSLGNAAFLLRFYQSGLGSVDQFACMCQNYIVQSKRGLLRYLNGLRHDDPLFKGFFSGITGEIYQLCALHWPERTPALLALDVTDAAESHVTDSERG